MNSSSLLTTEIIRKEYAFRMSKKPDDLNKLYLNCVLKADDFSIEELSLSLEEFSRNRGWIR